MQSTWERVQSIDCKDDPTTQVENACTEWEISFFLNKELENIKNNEIELKNTITEMKSTLEGINSRLNEEEWITELEDRVVEIIMAEQKRKKWKEIKTA